jgi:hypothetical protein
MLQQPCLQQVTVLTWFTAASAVTHCSISVFSISSSSSASSWSSTSEAILKVIAWPFLQRLIFPIEKPSFRFVVSTASSPLLANPIVKSRSEARSVVVYGRSSGDGLAQYGKLIAYRFHDCIFLCCRLQRMGFHYSFVLARSY